MDFFRADSVLPIPMSPPCTLGPPDTPPTQSPPSSTAATAVMQKEARTGFHEQLISTQSMWWTCSSHRVEQLLISLFSLVDPKCLFYWTYRDWVIFLDLRFYFLLLPASSVDVPFRAGFVSETQHSPLCGWLSGISSSEQGQQGLAQCLSRARLWVLCPLPGVQSLCAFSDPSITSFSFNIQFAVGSSPFSGLLGAGGGVSKNACQGTTIGRIGSYLSAKWTTRIQVNHQLQKEARLADPVPYFICGLLLWGAALLAILPYYLRTSQYGNSASWAALYLR